MTTDLATTSKRRLGARATKRAKTDAFPTPARGSAADDIAAARDLAWAGRHEEAIAAASAALQRKTLASDARMTLLDLRAESFIAAGELERAAADAQAMKALARLEGGDALQARALCRESLVQWRRGDSRAAEAAATTASKAADRSGEPALVALSLFCLSRAQTSREDLRGAIRNATRAASIYETLGDISAQSRALLLCSNALLNSNHSAASKRASTLALALARRCGDRWAEGGALNSLGLVEADLAQGLRLYAQALDAYKRAGYVLNQATQIGNIGATYGDLGLYRLARRLTLEAADIARKAGARGLLPVFLWNLTEWALAFGARDEGSAFAVDAAAATRAVREKRFDVFPLIAQGWLAECDGQAAKAARYFERAARQSMGGQARLLALTAAGGAHLAAGKPAAALAETREAARLHRAMRFAPLDMVKTPLLWWRHSQACKPTGSPQKRARRSSGHGNCC